MAKKTKQSSTPQKGHCANCKHATLMQWEQDPLIADCAITNEREVAEAKQCSNWLFDNHPKDIKRFKKTFSHSGNKTAD